jgi:hypothetical protein
MNLFRYINSFHPSAAKTTDLFTLYGVTTFDLRLLTPPPPTSPTQMPPIYTAARDISPSYISEP